MAPLSWDPGCLAKMRVSASRYFVGARLGLGPEAAGRGIRKPLAWPARIVPVRRAGAKGSGEGEADPPDQPLDVSLQLVRVGEILRTGRQVSSEIPSSLIFVLPLGGDLHSRFSYNVTLCLCLGAHLLGVWGWGRGLGRLPRHGAHSFISSLPERKKEDPLSNRAGGVE